MKAVVPNFTTVTRENKSEDFGDTLEDLSSFQGEEYKWLYSLDLGFQIFKGVCDRLNVILFLLMAEWPERIA